MNEVWKRIRDTKYSVSNLGGVRNNVSQRTLKTGPNNKGYPSVILYNETREVWRVHRLVALAFVQLPENTLAENMDVDHVDNDKLNCVFTNLQWLTHTDNTQKARDDGLMVYHKGSAHHAAVLDETTVNEVRQLAIDGVSYTMIGKYFGVCSGTTSSIIRRLNWKHVPEADSAGIDTLLNATESPIGLGSSNKMSKLTETDVSEIRIRLREGMSQGAVARLFKVSGTTISDIVLGKTWAHL